MRGLRASRLSVFARTAFALAAKTVVLFVLALVLHSATGSPAGAGSELPPAGIHPICDPATKGDERFCPTATAGVANDTPGEPSNVTVTFDIPSPQYNFRAHITFLPPDWNVPLDEDVPTGARTGQLTSMATLGLLNGACNTVLPVSFNLMDATTDTSNQITFLGQFTIMNGLPLGVTRYPDFLGRMFADEEGNPIAPLSRQYGQMPVAGIDISLNFLVFEPGTRLGAFTPHPDMGYPSVTVLLNIGDPALLPFPSPITDFCTPLQSTLTSFGVTQNNPNTAANEAGHPYYVNPEADGSHVFTTFAASLWDANRNGLENGLDPCKHRPWVPQDYNWNPRTTTGAPPAQACGLTAWPGSEPDIDSDGFFDRQDNCPWIANVNQADSNFDAIGNVCYEADSIDPEANPADLGSLTYHGCVHNTVIVGAGGAEPEPVCDVEYEFEPRPLPPELGSISGTVTDAETEEPLDGICIWADGVTVFWTGQAETNASGEYVVEGLYPGDYKVRFSSCLPPFFYIAQWYDGKPDWSTADLVTVEFDEDTPGIDAAMERAGTISGAVTDRKTGEPIEGICVTAQSDGFYGFSWGETGEDGEYILGGLDTGSYRVRFYDCRYPAVYVAQWYDDKPSLITADPVPVTRGEDTPGIHAAMDVGGAISGTVINISTGQPISDACVDVYDGSFTWHSWALSDEDGHYIAGGLPSGSFKVVFWPCYYFLPQAFEPTWYHRKSTFQTADPVTVVIKETVEGIDGEIVMSVANTIWGDLDCSGAMNVGDALKIARHLLGLAVEKPDSCPILERPVIADGDEQAWGDVDCDGAVTIGDALKIARALIDLAVSQADGCPQIGGIVPDDTPQPPVPIPLRSLHEQSRPPGLPGGTPR